jgi:hypothetical protein
LAAVANAESEGVEAFKKCFELGAQFWVKQNGFCPPAASAKDIAVTKAAAGNQTAKVCEGHVALYDIVQVNIDAGKTGAVEGCQVTEGWKFNPAPAPASSEDAPQNDAATETPPTPATESAPTP